MENDDLREQLKKELEWIGENQFGKVFGASSILEIMIGIHLWHQSGEPWMGPVPEDYSPEEIKNLYRYVRKEARALPLPTTKKEEVTLREILVVLRCCKRKIRRLK